MRKTTSLVAFSFLVTLFSGSAFAAFCDPQNTSMSKCVYEVCSKVGTTVLDKDRQTVIACLSVNPSAGNTDVCKTEGRCRWRNMTWERGSANPQPLSFEDKDGKRGIRHYNNGCTWVGEYKEGGTVEISGPWAHYFACTNACYNYCKSLTTEGYNSGFIAEWYYPTATAICNCVY